MTRLLKYIALAVIAVSATSTAHANCFSGQLLAARQVESLVMAQANASKIHRALDNVMDATGPYNTGDAAFDKGVNYVLSLQLNQDHMDIQIDNAISKTAAEFRANWGEATKALKYRKRTEDDWTLASYEEDPSTCLRKITAYSTGKNFNITNTPIANSTPPSNAANYSVDRFTVTLQEVDSSVGHGCNFNFRIVSLKQITEARFPLPPVPVPAAAVNGSPIQFGIITSPLDPASLALVPLVNC